MHTRKPYSIALLLLWVSLHLVCPGKEKSLFDDLPLNGAYDPNFSTVESVKVPSKTKEFILPRKKVNHIESDSSDLSFASTDDNSESEEEVKSLFDQMPNQGALPSKSGDLSVLESRTQKRSFKPHPELLIRSDPASKGLELEIQKLTPSEEFTFRQNFFPLQVKSTQDFPHTVFSPIVPLVQVPTGPEILNHPKPVSIVPPSRGYPNTIFDAIPVRSSDNNGRPRNPSIIVYGAPPPNQATRKETFPNKERVNHYHFRQPQRPPPSHFHKNNERLKPPKFLQPQTPNFGDRIRTVEISGGYGGGGQTEAPVSITTPPPTSTAFETTTSGTTSIASTTQSLPSTNFPVIVDGSLNDPVGTGCDYDYDTLTNPCLQQRQKQFRSRTGSGSLSLGFGLQAGNSRDSFKTPSAHFSPPSESYGPPSIPLPTYGPPLPLPPIPSYGPPAETPPPFVEPPAPPPNQGTTSISYQTIPIQTVHTELITVPHVTISASSGVDSDTQSDTSFGRPSRPSRPSTGNAYGPPTSFGNNDSPARGGLPSGGGIFTDDQIAALLAVARGGSETRLTEEDLLETLVSEIRGNERENIIGDSFGSRNILSGNLLRGNLGGFRLGGSRQRNPSFNRRRNNFVSNDQILASLLNQQRRESDIFGSNRNRFSGPARGLTRGTVLTGDAVDAVSDLIREQRLRTTVADLSGRLRFQNQNTERTNERYRSLFYKGALLLSALTLIPAVASPFAAAANSAVTSGSFSHLLPLAAGRRRREVSYSPFQECMWQDDPRGVEGSDSSTGFNDWFNCALNATELVFEKNANETGEGDLDLLKLEGTLTPQVIREDIKKTVSTEEIKKNSQCLQKRFCETILEVETLPNGETLLLLYSIFASDIENNPWVQESLSAAKQKNCETFYCSEDKPGKGST